MTKAEVKAWVEDALRQNEVLEIKTSDPIHKAEYNGKCIAYLYVLYLLES